MSTKTPSYPDWVRQMHPGILRAADRSSPYRDAGTNQRTVDVAKCTELVSASFRVTSKDRVAASFLSDKGSSETIEFSQEDFHAIVGTQSSKHVLKPRLLWHGSAHRSHLLGDGFDE